ncbi:hypothetical protein HORIV_44950 [Vreelandella olivaria]|uniref:Uncharacterized protein n=1 Tax=Vreelandella olivaria TaxID=390919 RepID=A0ABM7GN73_9GAMM|nr:hypothetical protein HORIV_44950 [Halomonas olivaria]
MQSAWHNPFQAISQGLSESLSHGLGEGFTQGLSQGVPEGLSPAEIEAWNNQLKEISEQYQGLMQDLLSRIAPSEAADSIYSDMRESFEAGAQSLMQNPTLLWETQSRLLQDQWLLWQQAVRGMAGEQVTPLITPAKVTAASKMKPGPKTRTTWPLCSSTYCFRRWWKSWLKV